MMALTAGDYGEQRRAGLQRTEGAAAHLRPFLDAHRFTHAVFMAPHPDCFFDFQANAGPDQRTPTRTPTRTRTRTL